MAMEIQFVVHREARSQALTAFIHAIEKLQRMIVHPQKRKGPVPELPEAADIGRFHALGRNREQA
jgi:hypothetical protein